MAAALGVLVAAPLAHAQQSPPSPDPADPGAAVPQPVYDSALTGYTRTPQDNGVTPDKTWREVNEAVAPRPDHAAHPHHQNNTQAEAQR
jgi:hypothetical protein